MPWAVSCCPFGASLGANLLNAALLLYPAEGLYTPKALHAPQVLYPAEGPLNARSALPAPQVL